MNLEKLSQLKPPRTYWVEDKDGNTITEDIGTEYREIQEGEYVHYVNIEMTESCFVKKRPYSRFKAWIARKLGLRYDNNGQLYEAHCSGNSITPIVRELLNRGWRLDHAMILGYELCEGCLNELLSAIEGYDYHDNPGTKCRWCETIRPELVAGYKDEVNS